MPPLDQQPGRARLRSTPSDSDYPWQVVSEPAEFTERPTLTREAGAERFGGLPMRPVESFPRSPAASAGISLFDDLPDYGGADAPSAGDDVELDLIEAELRDRLRREGKLSNEPGGVDNIRERAESTKDSLIRFATEVGGTR